MLSFKSSLTTEAITQQYTTPHNQNGIAFDASGNIWLGANDTGLQVKNPNTGAITATYGSAGTGNGQFGGAIAIAIGSR